MSRRCANQHGQRLHIVGIVAPGSRSRPHLRLKIRVDVDGQKIVHAIEGNVEKSGRRPGACLSFFNGVQLPLIEAGPGHRFLQFLSHRKTKLLLDRCR
jgi:endonuclease V-like protein UPF0215 family